MKKYTKEQEWEIRENLYISSEAYDGFWEEWKESIYETLNKNAELLEKNNVRYCFESDIDYEKEFVEEDEENEFIILLNDNGLIIYESREKAEDLIMKVPETYKKDFIHLIQTEYNRILQQIEQHENGTYEREKAIEYANFLVDILESND